MERLTQVLREGVRRQASDILISAGSPVTYHVFGVLQRAEPPIPLTAEDTRILVLELLDSDQQRELEDRGEIDTSVHIPEVARFRVNAFRQKSTLAAVLRVVPFQVPRYTEIGISDQLLIRLTGIPDGLVLVTGPTGAGKSTTVASLLQYLNLESEKARHIITIEDPIEFMIESSNCVVDQRELGVDTRSYASGLRSALRQMPHIIFVGEMRDRETIEIAMTAAETGNLVISTLSTQSASKTVNRIVDVFPVHDQNEVRARLSLSLRATISQVLLPRRDRSGRVAAREVLFVNNSVANLIREGKVHQINNVIAGARAEGMMLLDESLLQLYRDRLVDAADIVTRLQDPERMRAVVGS